MKIKNSSKKRQVVYHNSKRELESKARALEDHRKELLTEMKEIEDYRKENYYIPAGSTDAEEVVQYFADKAKKEALDLIEKASDLSLSEEQVEALLSEYVEVGNKKKRDRMNLELEMLKGSSEDDVKNYRSLCEKTMSLAARAPELIRNLRQAKAELAAYDKETLEQD